MAPEQNLPMQPFSDENAKNITRVEELGYAIRVSEVMTHDLDTLSPSHRMADVLELLRQKQISGAPVIFNSELIGVISLEDLIRALIDQDLNSPVGKYMSTNIITTRSYDPVVEALKIFSRTHVGRLPVVDEKGALVGMITKGDISQGLLKALQKDFQEEEVRRFRARHLFDDIISDRTSLILRYQIQARDFLRGGNASSHIKRALLRLGANPQIARRCGIAIYEAEMNLIIHTNEGGFIRVEIEPHRIKMQAIDDGPGIPDVKLAMQAGYSTASEEIREMGFGAGMGLFNISRCVDEISIESGLDTGTRLEMKILLQPEDVVGETSHFYGE
jgi:CBS domain-containing protein/anti-sigma regulatory factor (Ser/Thr protein kinase)